MSGKSKEEIAFELVSKLKGVGVWGENNMAQILDMYAKCLEATSGLREVDGKAPSALRLQGSNPAPTTSKAAPQPAALRPAVPLQQPPAQSPQVRQQQQMVQQAYQQQQPPVAR
jgi:hypothetical protein